METSTEFILHRHHYGSDEWQFGDLRVPVGEGPFPVVVVIHGGFWYAEYGLDLMDDISDNLARCGCATWNIEYRRVGHEGGGYPGTLHDVAAATDALRGLAEHYPLNLNTVVAVGHSAGGHLALWLSGRHRVPKDTGLVAGSPLPITGVVSLAGVTDLHLMNEVRTDIHPVVDFIGGNPEEYPNRCRAASPRALLPLGVPQILVHGTEDDRVPMVLSSTYYEAARQAGDRIEFVRLPNVEHFKVINPASEAWPAIAQAIHRLITNT